MLKCRGGSGTSDSPESTRHANVQDQVLANTLQEFEGKHLRIGQISVLPIPSRHAFRQAGYRCIIAILLIECWWHRALKRASPLISRDPLLDPTRFRESDRTKISLGSRSPMEYRAKLGYAT